MGDTEETVTYHFLTEIPPGGQVSKNSETGETTLSVQLWKWWLEIARQHADEASLCETPDAVIDAMSSSIRSAARGDAEAAKVPDNMPGADHGNKERYAAMVAVVSSAMAIDGFYGCIKPLVNGRNTPKKPPARERQILEVIKLGFHIGKHAKAWLDDLDWLFKTRNGIAHHGAQEGEPVILRVTKENTVVLGAPDTYGITAGSAQRAAVIAETVIGTCVAAPKPATRSWVDWYVKGEDPTMKEHR